MVVAQKSHLARYDETTLPARGSAVFIKRRVLEGNPRQYARIFALPVIVFFRQRARQA